MPVKYRRPDFRESASGSHGRFNAAPGRRPLNPRQRLLIVYLGLCGFVVALLAFHAFNPFGRFRGQPTLQGQAVIQAKKVIESDDEGPQYFLELRIETEPGAGLTDTVKIDAEHWRQFREDQQLFVTYQVSRSGTRAYIHALHPEQDETPMLEDEPYPHAPPEEVSRDAATRVSQEPLSPK